MLRTAAFRARRKELEQALQGVDVGDLEKAATQASLDEDSLLKARNDRADDIQRQISLLQGQLRDLEQEYAPRFEAARLARHNAYGALHEERERQTAAIEAQFPDLGGGPLMGCGAWEPPAGYIEKFAAAYADELARKKAKREKGKTT